MNQISDTFRGFESEEGLFLHSDEFKHCFKVLRKQVGEVLRIIDGLGSAWLVEIIKESSETGRLKVIDTLDTSSNSNRTTIHLVVAPMKSSDKIEWLLEKSIETGIESFILLLTKRTERRKVNLERLEKLAWSALKQSGNLKLPEISLLTFEQFLQRELSNPSYIAFCSDNNSKCLISEFKNKDSLTVAIGPEGDFTPDEIENALQKGFKPLSLGKQRFRTETAALLAVMACHVLAE